MSTQRAKTAKGKRRTPRYANQQIRQFRDNDVRPQQTTTVRLPRRLYEEARSAIASGGTEARSLNDLLVDSLSDRLRKLRREHIDAEFAGMKNDAQYRQESTELAERFTASDWETLQSLEKEEA